MMIPALVKEAVGDQEGAEKGAVLEEVPEEVELVAVELVEEKKALRVFVR